MLNKILSNQEQFISRYHIHYFQIYFYNRGYKIVQLSTYYMLSKKASFILLHFSPFPFRDDLLLPLPFMKSTIWLQAPPVRGRIIEIFSFLLHTFQSLLINFICRSYISSVLITYIIAVLWILHYSYPNFYFFLLVYVKWILWSNLFLD